MQCQGDLAIEFYRPYNLQRNRNPGGQSIVEFEQNAAARYVHTATSPYADDFAVRHPLVSDICGDRIPASRASLSSLPLVWRDRLAFPYGPQPRVKRVTHYRILRQEHAAGLVTFAHPSAATYIARAYQAIRGEQRETRRFLQDVPDFGQQHGRHERFSGDNANERTSRPSSTRIMVSGAFLSRGDISPSFRQEPCRVERQVGRRGRSISVGSCCTVGVPYSGRPRSETDRLLAARTPRNGVTPMSAGAAEIHSRFR